MHYRVIMAPDAKADLQAAHRYIRDRAPQAAKEWLRDVRSSIRTLSRFPERCPMAPEATLLQKPIRQLFFGKGSRGTYRILFTVSEKSVNVLHVRHGSMLPLGGEEMGKSRPSPPLILDAAADKSSVASNRSGEEVRIPFDPRVLTSRN